MPVSKTSPLLQIKELRRLMLGPLSFSVGAGECLCLSGPSGAGKTLLLRAIADLDPHAGEVWLDGAACGAFAPEDWRRDVGLLPPESSWWLPGVREHFHNGVPVPLDQVGLDTAILDKPVRQLSSGEKQRLALMRLLANRPRALLLDEPTANLDAGNTRRIEAVIAGYRREHGAAVVWVSHDREQIERVSGRHLELVDGQLREGAGE